MSLRVYKRGQIWWVDLDPTKGSELKKKRPCVIVNTDAIRQRLPIKIVVPLTDWQASFAGSHFHVRVDIDDATAFEAMGLTKGGAADVMQLRCVSEQRFGDYIAMMSPDRMEEIALAIATLVEAS